ncbi:MAG: hypothetical protein ACYC91_19620 [Solirubrobacteraceae bacterium]
MTRLLLAIVARSLAPRLAPTAIAIALAMVLIHSGTFARHAGEHTVGAVERVVQPIEHDLQQVFEMAVRR